MYARGETIHPDKNAMTCIVEICDSHNGNRHSINYESNATALFEHQSPQSAQPIIYSFSI